MKETLFTPTLVQRRRPWRTLLHPVGDIDGSADCAGRIGAAMRSRLEDEQLGLTGFLEVEPDYTADRLLVGLGWRRRTGVNNDVAMPEENAAQTVTAPALITA